MIPDPVPSIYPLFGDFDRYARTLTPSQLRQERAWAVVWGCLRAFLDLDDQQAEIIRQMDPDLATDAMLDRCGSRVFEPRGGLGDPEYRRVIAGRTACGASRGTAAGVWRTWLALSGASPDRATMYRWGPPPTPVIILTAEYDFTPSAPFLRRGGQVLLDAVAYPFDVIGILVPAGGLRFDGTPGLDHGIIGYEFRTERPA